MENEEKVEEPATDTPDEKKDKEWGEDSENTGTKEDLKEPEQTRSDQV